MLPTNGYLTSLIFPAHLGSPASEPKLRWKDYNPRTQDRVSCQFDEVSTPEKKKKSEVIVSLLEAVTGS